MAEYSITRLDSVDDGADASPWHRFRVTKDGEQFCQGRIRASRSLMHCGSMRSIDWDVVFDTLLLGELEARFAADLVNESDGAVDVVLSGAEAEQTILELAAGGKRCKWLVADDGKGDFCTATPDHREPTTPPLCGTCEMPDSRVVCSALVHPTVRFQGGMTIGGSNGAVTVDSSRTIDQAYCRAYLQSQNWELCHASGQECWRRLVPGVLSAPLMSPDSPRRLIDAIPYLRLAYADRFGAKPSVFWPPIDERSVAMILAPCGSAMELQQHISALDTLVTRMQPHPQLLQARQLDSEGRKVGSISALARVLEDRCGGDALPHVQRLRALNRARNSYPVHPHSGELQQALRVLGVGRYPPEDWQSAWWQIATSLEESLTAIRLAVQTGSDEIEDSDS